MEIIEVCNIWKLRCDIDLSKGNVLCPVCKGQGAEFSNASFKQRKFTVFVCKMCLGEGKVDWITAINKRIHLTTSSNVKYIKMRCGGKKKCRKKLKRLWSEQNKPFSDIYFDIMMGRR